MVARYLAEVDAIGSGGLLNLVLGASEEGKTWMEIFHTATEQQQQRQKVSQRHAERLQIGTMCIAMCDVCSILLL
jgi:hypothetical protein